MDAQTRAAGQWMPWMDEGRSGMEGTFVVVVMIGAGEEDRGCWAFSGGRHGRFFGALEVGSWNVTDSEMQGRACAPAGRRRPL